MYMSVSTPRIGRSSNIGQNGSDGTMGLTSGTTWFLVPSTSVFQLSLPNIVVSTSDQRHLVYFWCHVLGRTTISAVVSGALLSIGQYDMELTYII